MAANLTDFLLFCATVGGVREIIAGFCGFFDAFELLCVPAVDLRDQAAPGDATTTPSDATLLAATPSNRLCAFTGYAASPSPLMSAAGAPAVANFSLFRSFRSPWALLGLWPATAVVLEERMPLGEAVAWGLARLPAPAAPVALPLLPGSLSTQFSVGRHQLAASALPPAASLRVPPAPASWGAWAQSLLQLSSDEGAVHQQLSLPLGALVTVVGVVREVRLTDGRLSLALCRDWRRGLFLLGGAGDLAGFRAHALRACGAQAARALLGAALVAALALWRRAAAARAAPARIALPPDAPPDAPATDENARCVVCWEMASCVALAPCGHVCLCAGCVPRLVEQQLAQRQPALACPTCRHPVASVVRVFQ
jgi:hypothetical protein